MKSINTLKAVNNVKLFLSMFYTDYKEAAERHLETCLHIAEKLSYFEDKRLKGGLNSKEVSTQENLLANLYYLSGYMIECLYNYAMCKKGSVPDTVLTKDLDRSPLYGTLPICFSFSKKNTTFIRYCLYRKGHQMTLSDLSFLDSYANSENIPLLHNNTHFSDPYIRFLFDNWSAYERYKTNYSAITTFPIGISSFPFTYQHIIKFFWEIVNVCAKMSQFIVPEARIFVKAIKKKPETILI